MSSCKPKLTAAAPPPPPDSTPPIAKRTFALGERVEAIWSSDGQKYPGRILHAFPNDNYDVLFDDGVKSRRKSSLIFKTGPPPLTPRPPQLHPHNKSSSSDSISTNNNMNNSSSSHNHDHLQSDLQEQEDATPTTLTPSNSDDAVQKTNGNSTPPSNEYGGDGGDGGCGGGGANTEEGVSELGGSSDSSSPSKKGFVYVQQPHYSVFDPPPSDLGKRARRVHNYSMLAKGPPLKKGLLLTNGGGGTSEDGSIDGEFLFTSTTPTSTPGSSRSSSPNLTSSTAPLINHPSPFLNSSSSHPPPLLLPISSTSSTIPGQGGQGSSSTRTRVSSSLLPTPTPGGGGGSRFVRKRRFLKSPPKLTPEKGEGRSSISTFDPFHDVMDTEEGVISIGTETTPTPPPAAAVKGVAAIVKPKVTPTPSSSISRTTPTPTTRDTPTTAKGGVGGVTKKKTEFAAPLAPSSTPRPPHPPPPALIPINLHHPPPPAPTPTPPPTPTPTGDEGDSGIPSKRLRKPSHRFSAEEGYVDIFSQQRTSRTRRSSPLSGAPKSQLPSLPSSPSPATAPVSSSSVPPSPSSSSTATSGGTPTPTNSPATSQGARIKKRKRGRQPGFRPVRKVPLPPPDLILLPQSTDPTTPTPTTPADGEEDELLEIGGDYSLLPPPPPPATPTSPNKSLNKSSPPKRQTRNGSGSVAHLLGDYSHHPLATELNKSGGGGGGDPSSNHNLVERPLRQTSRGRIVRPPPLKTETIGVVNKEPGGAGGGLLDRLSIPKVLVEKCDSVIPSTSSHSTSTTSSTSTRRHSSASSASFDPSGRTNIVHKFGAPPSGASIFSGPPPPSRSKSKDAEEEVDPEDDLYEEEEEDEEDIRPPTTPYTANKVWNKKKRRWTRGPRPSTTTPTPALRSGGGGIDSHAMQLLKRSRLQSSRSSTRTGGGQPGQGVGDGVSQGQGPSSDTNRGRPKVVLLKGITKKRLKKITESIRKRKLAPKRIGVATKFKDVRVDIINCVCGRTDEFGLMVQCEVCMCWQHGNCFGYFEGSTLPRFYVCQSCGDPKNVRPSHKTEGIRQESYKKGILPSFPYAVTPSLKQQRIFKRCHDLTRMVSSIEGAIRQNRLKEMIATSEPEHRKLYQWSAPRPHPRDLVQKWSFNKFFKPVLRRLILRHKGKPDYMDKLGANVAFRDKLKKYGAAFEEAKLAISRKIGSRGLILVEKLSEQERKLERIARVKEKLDSELSLMPVGMRNSLLAQMMDKSTATTATPTAPSSSFSCFSELTFTDSSDSGEGGGGDLLGGGGARPASSALIQEFISKFGELLGEEEPEVEDEEEEELEQVSIKPDGTTEGPEVGGEAVVIKSEPLDLDDVGEFPSPNSSSFTITHNENAELAQEIARFNLEQLAEHNVPILGDDEEEDNWVEMKVKDNKDTTTSSTSPSPHNTSTASSTDMIKLMLSSSATKRKNKKGDELNSSTASASLTGGSGGSGGGVVVVDVESESEATLSGDTTVSVEDSEGGEEYWYNPITQLNTQYDTMRKILLTDPLVEPDSRGDGAWRRSGTGDTSTLRRDWIDELDFYLNGDLGLGLDSISESDDDEEGEEESYPGLSSSSDGESGEEEQEEGNGVGGVGRVPPSSESDQEEEDGKMEEATPSTPRYWQKALLHEQQDLEEDEEEEWIPESMTDSEEEEEQKEEEESLPVTIAPPPPHKSPDSSSVDPIPSEFLFVSSGDPDSRPGDIINVRVKVGGGAGSDPATPTNTILRSARVLGGLRGENWIKLLSPEEEGEAEEKKGTVHPFGTTPTPSSLLLCGSCTESLGRKWSWKELEAAKGVNILLEDTLSSLASEVERLKHLGLATLDARAALDMDPSTLNHPLFNSQLKHNLAETTPIIPITSTCTPVTTPTIKTPLHEPRKLTEICREVLSKPRINRNRKAASAAGGSGSFGKPSSLLASAEEESILTLLSLSKTPSSADSGGVVPSPVNGTNGENVSELSIESLRKLTDRLSHGGPLSEDLAKAVTGPLPLTNGKILAPFPPTSSSSKLDNSKSTTSAPTTTKSTPLEPICVRCSLQEDSAQKLYILITSNPTLCQGTTPTHELDSLRTFCSSLSSAVEDVRLAAHATRTILLHRVSLLAGRKRAERTARDLGVKITPSSLKRRLQLVTPHRYLSGLKGEFVDALLPYATYFISRFTKRDQVSGAKKAWIGDMIQHYNGVKRTLRGMYGVGGEREEERRLEEEDKFYGALDNLRKSFDIVLTKRDIKMRRQNQSLSMSEEQQVQGEVQGVGKATTPTPQLLSTPEEGQEVEGVEEERDKMEVDVEEETGNGGMDKSSPPLPLVNGIKGEAEEEESGNNPIIQVNNKPEGSSGHVEIANVETTPTPQPEDLAPLKPDENGVSEPLPPPTTTQTEEEQQQQLQELEILARLANYPIQVEDVNALLGIANEQAAAAEEAAGGLNEGASTTTPTPTEINPPTTTTTESQPLELDDFRLIEENLGGDMELINTIGSLGMGGGSGRGGPFKGAGGTAAVEETDSDLLLNVFDDPLFSEPPPPPQQQQSAGVSSSGDPVPCSSRSISNSRQQLPSQSQMCAPSLAKLTPEMCKGFLLDDIRAHQQIIDTQLDKLEAEIMELERRRGNGLKDKDDHKLFEMLYANMQILLENTDVLHELTHSSVGLDNEEVGLELEDIVEDGGAGGGLYDHQGHKKEGGDHHHQSNTAAFYTQHSDQEEEDEDDMFVLKS